MKDKILDKINIVDVISSYVPLVKKGANYFGVCPFHDDVNPSMSVSEEKQIYKCFACGAGGNAITFVMDYDKLTYQEALKKLGNTVGINLEIKTPVKKHQKELDIFKKAVSFYENNLNSSYGKEARAYLGKRKITQDEITKFKIGLSLKEAPLKEVFKDTNSFILENIGLVKNNKDVYYERIMFPLDNEFGDIVGFSGRIYNKEDSFGKYINTEETPIFKKSKILYNYKRGVDAARKKGFLIVCEGFMDVIRLSSVGYDNAVALMGTASTDYQVELLKRGSNNLYLFLDGDEAGVKATLSLGDKLLKKGLNISILELNSSLDPDTFIIKEGLQGFEKLLDRKVSFTDFKMRQMSFFLNKSSPNEVAEFTRKRLLEISLEKDELKKELSLKNLAKITCLEYTTLEKELRGIKPIKNEQKFQKKTKNKFDLAHEAIILLLIENPNLLEYLEEKGVYFTREKYKNLYLELTCYIKENDDLNLSRAFHIMGENEEYIKILQEIIQNEPSLKALDDYLKVVKEDNKNTRVERLLELLKKEKDPLKKAKLAENIRSIRKKE